MKTSVICIGITGAALILADLIYGSGDNVYVISMITVVGIWMRKDDNKKSE